MAKIPIIVVMLTFLAVIAKGQEDAIPDQHSIFLEKIDSSNVVEASSKILLQQIKDFPRRVKEFPSQVKDFFSDEKPKPQKALWMTFLLPGSGQAYNKKHWKIPIVYTGIGAFTYAIAYNTRNFNRFKRAYEYRLDKDESTVEEELTRDLSHEALQNIREGYRKNLDRSYIGLAIFYVVVGIDAYVDAHMHDFDVSDDLSLNWKPVINGEAGQTNMGVGLTLTFGYRKPKRVYLHPDFENP